MRKFLLFIMLMAAFIFVSAQKEGRLLVDSLIKALSQAKEDTNKVRLLATISYELRHVDPQAGIRPGLKALILAMKLNDHYGQGLARFSLALNYNYLSMLSESIDQSMKAAAIFEKAQNYDLLAATWFGLAQTYMSFDSATSHRTLLKAKALLPRGMDRTWMVRNLGSLGNSYKNLGQNDSAIRYIRLHLALASRNHMTWQLMMARNRIGSIYFFEGKADSAYRMLKEALEYFKVTGANQMVAQNSQTLGRLIAGRIPARGLQRDRYLDTAISYGKEALYAANKIGFVMQMLGSTRLLADLFAMKGDTATAFEYLVMSEKYNETLYGVTAVTRASMLNVKNEQRLKNQQLELLLMKNRQQLVFIIVSACGVGIMVIVVLLIIQSRRKLKRTYNLVNRHKEEITSVLGELETTNRKLETTNQELEGFSYSVSHDLHAPIRRIEGLSNILKEDYEKTLDDEGKDLLSRIIEASLLMNQLIEDMLKLSMITRQTVKKTPCNLSDMAAKICQDLKLSYHEQAVTFTIEEGIVAEGDAQLLRIALQNLLDNAWKYSSKAEHPQVTVGSQLHDGRNVIFIRDNGVGFDMSQAGKLFVPFQRLHSDDQFKGTGIGLATVKRIIVKHGGTIEVQSEPGNGSTFSFSLG